MSEARIIKFRCWDRRKEAWIFPTSQEVAIQISPKHDLPNFELWPNYDFVLMQFTGLLDKNGKEIYAGDIVRYYDSMNMWLTSDVFNTGACFSLRTPENPIPLYEFCSTYIYDSKPIKEIEVIGNIHENPELLTHERGED